MYSLAGFSGLLFPVDFIISIEGLNEGCTNNWKSFRAMYVCAYI